MGLAEWRQAIASKIPATRSVYRLLQQRRYFHRCRQLFQQHLRFSDVFIVGHPKSGNTWLTYMLAILLYKDNHYHITLSNLAEYIPFIHGDDRAIASYSNLSEPRIFRNEQPVYPELYPKAIYVIRDPRAVLASYYHHYCTVTNDTKASLRGFVEDYLLHGHIKNFDTSVSRWDRQVLEWIGRSKENGRVIMIKYEDMVRDRKRVLKNVVAFADIPCTKEDIALAAARGGFETMRAVEEQYGAESYPGEIGQRGRFIRRGKAEGWLEEMPPNLVERIEYEFGQAMKEAGYL